MPVHTIRTELLEVELHEDGPGDGRPVVLLHGWPDAPRGWQEVAERLHRSGWRTIAPAWRGSGGTRFRSAMTLRDGRGVALVADTLDLLNALGLDRVPVVGHDWGARVAYMLAAVAPERVTAIITLALAYQPRGLFVMPSFEQARAFWYQWLMYVDDGASAVASDPIGFARIQWDTWSPQGWFDDNEFRATAESFANPDWIATTLHAYRSRFLSREPCDPRYELLERQIAEVQKIAVPTLMIQGVDDRCDPPHGSADQEKFFTGGYRRALLNNVGHFPHREAPDEVARLISEHLEAHVAGAGGSR
jgi:pimeloyl-ACP methyl ester carboxylesterase